MTKHERTNRIAHNNKETKNKDNGVYVDVSKDDKERAEIAVELVKEAFALNGKNTKVIDYRANHFNVEKQRFERNVRFYGVRPVDDEGKSINFGLFGTELDWAEVHKKLKKQTEERAVAVTLLAENKKLRNLIKDKA